MPISAVAQSPGRRAAADYLQQLLLKPGAYRQSWEKHVSRGRTGNINQLAVAEVLARHLGRFPRGPADACITSHQLKDLVSRALSGRLLSRSSLGLFIDAFGFSEHEADRLWQLWNGSATISVLSGSHAVSTRAELDLTQALGPRQHQTLSLHEHVYVGSDGRIDRARTLKVVEATAPGVDRIPFLCDTSVLTLEVGQGCKGLAGDVRQVRKDVFATEILLARTLGLGETLTLEYWVTYRFPGDPRDLRERQYRQAVMRHLENFDMRVEFHPDRLPLYVWWATWDGMEGGVLDRAQILPDSQHSVHHYLRSFEKTVAGFYWEWP